MALNKEGAIDQTKEREIKKSPLDLFIEVSGAPDSIKNEVRNTFKDLTLPTNAFEAGNALRMFLIDNGWQYDSRSFCLQDMLKEKKGNCLGLTMLVGAVLKDRGLSAQYEVITGIHDAYHRAEKIYFERLMNGDEFDYDHPTLPAKQAEHPMLYFLPLEHPVPILDGRPFETTNLEDRESDPGWKPEGEKTVSAIYEDVASNVLIDRAKVRSRDNVAEAETLCRAGMELSPDNREGMYMLWLLNTVLNKKEQSDEALQQYASTKGDDSRFLFNMYGITGNTKYLEKTLEKYPAHLHAFMEKFVRLETDKREAKFNFSVAAWCASNSKTVGLDDFYSTYREQLEQFYGKEGLKKYAGIK
ncbi:MAG: hypothetical protein PHD72_03070 [Patescibacteria group bacterium]|nr:hypothetical protein [Patescibacteria group bacterium]